MRATSICLLAMLTVSAAKAQTSENQTSSNRTLGKTPLTAQTEDSPKIEFLNLQQGQQEIIDETYEPYISGATDNFLRFCVGAAADAPIPSGKDQRREFAESALKGKVQTFSEAEQELIRNAVSKLNAQIREVWPLVSEAPWQFLKVDSSFCSGFPHTRGKTIVLPAGIMQVFQRGQRFSLNLLLHEKLHVLQRLYPERFQDLYHEYGFQKIQLADGEITRIDYGQNPDAFRVEWAIKIGDDLSMLIPTFQTSTDGRLRFAREHRALVLGDDGKYRFGDIQKHDDGFEQWRNGFNGVGGLDHPNETSAYLSALVFGMATPNADDFKTQGIPPSKKARVEQTENAFKEILRSAHSNP